MKKILWFSRHKMTPEQKLALGDVEIMQINKTINSAYELKDEIDECDIFWRMLAARKTQVVYP